MSFRLKEAVYKIRCREPGCTFASEFIVRENFMGVTEADVDSEALKIAKNMAFIKHDAMHGRKHQLANPEIFKISGSYERLGGLTSDSVFTQPAESAEAGGAARTFHRGEMILDKREDSAVALEIVRGSAQNAGHPGLKYRPGAIVGSATIFHQKSRPVDIVAAEDGTIVAFHDVKELTKTNPARARELYDRALDDVFNVLLHLEEYSASLEKKLKKLASPRQAEKPAPQRAVKKSSRSAARKRAATSGKRPRAKARRA